VFETALVLALRPELVARPPTRGEAGEPGARPDYRLEAHGAWLAIDGYTDSPDQAAELDGDAMLEAITTAVAAALVDFYRRTSSPDDHKHPSQDIL